MFTPEDDSDLESEQDNSQFKPDHVESGREDRAGSVQEDYTSSEFDDGSGESEDVESEPGSDIELELEDDCIFIQRAPDIHDFDEDSEAGEDVAEYTSDNDDVPLEPIRLVDTQHPFRQLNVGPELFDMAAGSFDSQVLSMVDFLHEWSQEVGSPDTYQILDPHNRTTSDNGYVSYDFQLQPSHSGLDSSSRFPR